LNQQNELNAMQYVAASQRRKTGIMSCMHGHGKQYQCSEKHEESSC